jgi:hypothetical protein
MTSFTRRKEGKVFPVSVPRGAEQGSLWLQDRETRLEKPLEPL